MDNVFFLNYQWIVKLLLCTFLILCLSCSTTKKLDIVKQVSHTQTLSISIDEQDYTSFMKKLKELAIKPINIHKIVNDSKDLLLLSFEYNSFHEYLFVRSAVLSTGLVSQIR